MQRICCLRIASDKGRGRPLRSVRYKNCGPADWYGQGSGAADLYVLLWGAFSGIDLGESTAVDLGEYSRLRFEKRSD